jgi:aminoglycoside 2'-N-acetyltransferase I
MDVAFGPDEEERFTEDDWQHAIGGRHYVLDVATEIVSHAAVVERQIHVGSRPLRTGYVEAVATVPRLQGAGLGTKVMEAVDVDIREHYELGVLGTGRHGFYERLGWRTWRGPSSVRTAEGETPTPEDDGYLLVLETGRSGPLDVTDPISCEWRPGDVW